MYIIKLIDIYLLKKIWKFHFIYVSSIRDIKITKINN